MKLKLFKGKTFHRMVIGGRGVNSQDLALGAQDQGPAQGAAGNVQGPALGVERSDQGLALGAERRDQGLALGARDEGGKENHQGNQVSLKFRRSGESLDPKGIKKVGIRRFTVEGNLAV